MPFAGFVVELQKQKLLPPSWRVVGAQVNKYSLHEGCDEKIMYDN